jgi:hypothetical protein
MLFLLRLAFWIMLICLLLPGSREDNRRLANSAERTVSDVRGFCQRNPEVCDDMRATMTSILGKFRSGAELLQSWLAAIDDNEIEKGAQVGVPQVQPIAPTSATPNIRSNEPLSPRPIAKWQDSLSPTDREVPWRGPATRL